MHVQTHLLAGWLAGNGLRLTPRERFLCMAAATLPDLDGLGIVVSEEAYWALHHKLGHNVFWFAGVAAVLTIFSSHRARAFACYFGLGWLHFLMDYLGSGPGWALWPWWPVGDQEVRWAAAWPFFGWQNLGAFFALLAATVAVAWRRRRTPLEWAMPSLDRRLLALLPRPGG